MLIFGSGKLLKIVGEKLDIDALEEIGDFGEKSATPLALDAIEDLAKGEKMKAIIKMLVA
ncbi:TPA: hypothetical protein NJ311_003633 [Vibrio parahaemolyticus]|nr:hypothetical protein [Vibrio parahaemolyticus]